MLVACGFSGPGSSDINGQLVLLGEAAGFLTERYGLKLSQMIAILVAGGYSERRYRQNSRNRTGVLRGLICPYSLSSPSS